MKVNDVYLFELKIDRERVEIVLLAETIADGLSCASIQ